MESAYEDEIVRPPINLPDIDLGVLFSNMARKQHLEDVSKYIQSILLFRPIKIKTLKKK